MRNIVLGIFLLITAATAMGGNDVWQTLFKEKLQEAQQGNSNAQFDIGAMYQNGRGVSPDRGKAIEWYEKAAAQDNQKAVNRLQLLQANEERFSKVLSSAGKGDKENQYKLGNMYTEGIGTNIDLAKAAESYEQSARQGYAKAEYKLGLVFYEGIGVKRSNKTAYTWFRQAAESGIPAAQYYLGKMYASGNGVKRDYGTSLEWYSKAVDSGFKQARSEMIEVKEKMKKPEPAKTAAAETVPKPPAVDVAISEKPPTAEKTFGIEDLMVAAWSRDGKPVAYLPSVINNCRTENGKISCYSDKQTRNTAVSTVKFKTKSIMRNFSNNGSFEVIYRNLIIDATMKTGAVNPDYSDEIGDDDIDAVAYTVKTGWGKEHLLECRMIEDSKVSCLKNKTYTFILESPQRVAAGS